ncbi:MAG: ROK family glucokinase [Clostridia bacterium]
MRRIGIDLGGTGIKVGCVSQQGEILSKVSCPTLAERPYEQVIDDMANLARAAAAQANVDFADIASVGVGIPGVEDVRTGLVPFCNNLGWRDVPLRAALKERLGKQVYVANDATVAALAEHVAGAGKGYDNLVLITLGTGVGGGVILNGEPFVGAHGVASEVGHMTIQMDGVLCNCGNRGCWERYASATALIREGREAIKSAQGSMIVRAVDGDPDKITAKTVIDCAKAGDPVAVRLFEEYAYHVGLGLANLVSAYDPDIFLLGGGVSAAGDFLLDEVRKTLKKRVFYQDMPYAKVELAILGNDAGIIGAAMLRG